MKPFPVTFFLGALVLINWVDASESGDTDKNGPKVGIIGAGIGGTAAAYFLSQSLPQANIHIFDEAKIGGRLATVKIAGREYEVGGSVIHPANKFMEDFLAICDMKKAKMSNQISGNVFSMHKDGQIIFQESSFAIWFKIQMIWRYGLWSLLKFDRMVENMLTNFGQIYPQLTLGSSFPTVESLLLAMGPLSKKGERSTEMLDMASVTLKKKLEDLGVSEDFINELVRVATRVNYGQMPDKMDAFVGSVALAGAQGGLWAVQGGNYRIPEHLLLLSKAELHKAKIEEVHKLNDGQYLLKARSEDENEVSSEEEVDIGVFDIVIVAAPQTADKPKVKFVGLDNDPKFPGGFHRTVATVIHGSPNPEALGFKDNSTMTKVNFFLSLDNILASMAQLTPVDFDPEVDKVVPSVWKIFSSRILTEKELDNLFVERLDTTVRDWLAYPEYITKKDPHLGRFVLAPGLFYTSDIEWAASAMEMSSIAAKNVVNLALEYWGRGRVERTNQFEDGNNNVKIEL